MQLTLFLKRILLLDAASCLGMGALLIAGAGALAPLLGLDRSLLFGAGLVLIPIGLFILWTATRRSLMPLAVYLIVAGNLAWVVESLLLIRGADSISAIRTVFVAAQAAMVAVLAILEWVGVRRAGRTAAQA